MPPDLVLRLHDKHGFALTAAEAGLAVPGDFALDDPAARDLAEAADVIVKPVHSCSGRGVPPRHRGAPLPPPEAAVVQRLVVGEEHSSCTLAHEGRVQGTAVYRGTLMSGSVAVGFERVDHPAIEAWIARFVAATGWTGFIAFDFIVDAAGTPWGIECNPRTTAFTSSRPRTLRSPFWTRRRGCAFARSSGCSNSGPASPRRRTVSANGRRSGATCGICSGRVT